MNAATRTPASPDQWGFYAAAQQISTIDLRAVMGRMDTAARRITAMLRPLNYQLLNDQKDVSLSDVQELVEMVLEILPSTAETVYAELDDYGVDVTHGMVTLLRREALLNTVLEQLARVSLPSADLDTFRAACTALHEACALLPEGERHWATFANLVSARGWRIGWLKLNEALSVPEVYTPEGWREHRKMLRRVKRLQQQMAQPPH